MDKEMDLFYRAWGVTGADLLQTLGPQIRMVLAGGLAIKELQRILPMDEGMPRERELEQLLEKLVKLEKMDGF